MIPHHATAQALVITHTNALCCPLISGQSLKMPDRIKKQARKVRESNQIKI